MQYQVYEYEGKVSYVAEGKVAFPLTYHPSDDGKKLAKELPCPCGCGFPVFINEHRGNCLGATLFLTYACMARATLKIDDVGEWEIDIEEGTGRRYSKTPSETFHREGVYPPPHAYHPADDAPRIISELVCPCGCGIASSYFCEHGNCEGATLYLTFPCGAVGELRMLDQGLWDLDVEPHEAHQKPFRCT